jgi:superfamily II DNA or RNA helicase
MAASLVPFVHWNDAITRSTLNLARRISTEVALHDLLFLRSAYCCTVIEKSGRAYHPVIGLDERRCITAWRCSCSEQPRPSDLCRHIALLLLHAGADGDEPMMSQRFETSLHASIGRALFEEFGAAVTHRLDDRFIRSSARGIEVVALDTRHTAEFRIYPPGSAAGAVTETHAGREKMLRRMAWSKAEAAMAERGMRSSRQAMEESCWFALSRALWLACDDPTAFRLESVGEGFALEAPPFRITAGRKIVEQLLDFGGGVVVERSGYSLRHEALEKSLRISISEKSELLFDPVLVTTGSSTRVLDRGELEPLRFGRFHYLVAERCFAGTAPPRRLFAEAEVEGQVSFQFGTGWTRSTAGFSLERQTVVPAHEVLGFLDRHRVAIASHPADLVAPVLRNPVTAKRPDRVFFRLERDTENRRCYRLAGSVTIGELDIPLHLLHAAKLAGDSFLLRKNCWIDLESAGFSWLELLPSPKKKRSKELTATRLEVLRVAGALGDLVSLEGDLDGLLPEGGSAAVAAAETTASSGLQLYDYQQNGVSWLWSLYRNGFGGLLCDDMGLGKTHQAMALITMAIRSGLDLPVLVVCPTSLIDHWKEKLASYAPEVPVEVHWGSGRALGEGMRVVISSYGTVRNDVGLMAGHRFGLLLLDEMQTLKNRATSTYQSFTAIQREVAIGLTGTPVENRLEELKALLDFVLPGLLPSDQIFHRLFVEPIVSGRPGGADERLRRMIDPFMLRRTKAQVLHDLPEKIIDKRFCTMAPEQAALYQEALDGGETILRQMREAGDVPYIHLFALLNRLKQLCNHPSLVGEPGAGSAKWDLFVELLDECLASGLKVVVFSQYVKMLRLIEKHLEERGTGFATIKGETRNRGEMIRRFHADPECRVFTASLRAGGLGIDLTAASVVIHYDRWWNQAREDQATDRVHRLGQNRGVQVLKLITRGTIEEKIDAIIERKQRLAADAVREDDPALARQFSREEIADLLSGR